MNKNQSRFVLWAILAVLYVFTMILFFGCTKAKGDVMVAQRCGNVTHKFYQNPPADTTLANRTYWLQWSPDTTCPPGNPNCGRYYDIQVPKSCWDTMLPPGASSSRYCLP